jgi:hypothetical protein
MTGLEHEEAVLSITNQPPASPTVGDLYIAFASPQGAWVGHANELCLWDGTAWQFSAPRTNESHLVEDVGEIWHWNGTKWVKVAQGSTALKAVAISKADYTTLSPKDPTTIYLVHN